MKKDMFIIKSKIIISISFAFLLISIGLQTKDMFIVNDNNQLNYEYVNIKDMASANVVKKENTKSIVSTLFTGNTTGGTLTEVSLPKKETPQEVALPTVTNSVSTPVVPRQIWRLPTEVGQITQYPHYSHVAYDITSPRTYSENIFPVANGVISGIYTDPAGAKVVTILHDIDGVKYTSQYAHMSRYASGIYVGKPVTVNDSIGLMGSTGNSTGPHLHITVADCALFDKADPNCSNLNGWFRYIKRRYNEGYYGLGVHINMPNSWNSR